MKAPSRGAVAPTLWERWRNHVFGTVYLMARRGGKQNLAPLFTLVEVLQMLYYPIRHLNDANWLAMLNSPIHPSNPSTRHLVPFGFWLALSWSWCFVAVAGAVLGVFATGRHQHPGVLRLLNSTAWLTTGPLFLPFAEQLLFGIQCENQYPDPATWWIADSPCWGGAHITVTLFTVLLFVALCAVSVFITSTLNVSASPDETGNRKMHGRIDTGLLLYKIWIVLLATFATDSLPKPAFGFMHVCGGCAYMWANLRMPGEADLSAVHPRVAFGALFSWAGLSVLAGAVSNSFAAQHVFLWGAPVVLSVGYFLSLSLYTKFLQAPLTPSWAVQHPHLANVWVFAWLQSGLLQPDTGILRDFKPFEPPEVEEVVETVGGGNLNCGASVVSDLNGGSGWRKKRRDGEATTVVSYVVKPATTKRPAIVSTVPPFVEALATAMMEDANNTAMSLYVLSHYHAVVTKKRFLEVSLLRRISTFNPPLDLQYVVYSRLRSLQETSTSNNVRGIERVLFDQHREATEKAMQRCYIVRADLWAHVDGDEPDIGQVVQFAVEFERSATEASTHMQAMLGLYPQSPEVLRALTLFYSELEPNRQRFDRFDAIQRRVEEHNSKHNKAVLPRIKVGLRSKEEVNAMAEDACIFMISAEAASVGEIITASREVRSVFGRPPSTFIGQNISCIMPSPFREIHDTFLLRFISQGTGTFIDTTRMVFIVAAGFALEPCWLSLREAPPQDGDVRPLFIGVLQTVESQDAHMFVSDGESGYRVLAGCVKTQYILGFDGEELMTERPMLGRWIQEFESGFVQPSEDMEECETFIHDSDHPGDSERAKIQMRVQTLAYPGADVVYMVSWRLSSQSGTATHSHLRLSSLAKTVASFGTSSKPSVLDGIVNTLNPVEQRSMDSIFDTSSEASQSAAGGSVGHSPRPESLKTESDGSDGSPASTLVPSDADSPSSQPKQLRSKKSEWRSSTVWAKSLQLKKNQRKSRVQPYEAATTAVSSHQTANWKSFLGSLRRLKDSTPPEVKQIQLFYCVMFLFMAVFAVSVWIVVGVKVGRLEMGLEVAGALQAAELRKDLMPASLLLAQLGNKHPNNGTVVDEAVFAGDVYTFGQAFEALDASVTSELEVVFDFWHQRYMFEHDTQPVPHSMVETLRYVERLASEIARGFDKVSVPHTGADTLYKALAGLGEPMHATLFVLVEDAETTQDALLFGTTVAVICMGASLVVMLAAWVLPEVRRLERRTSSILTQVVLLPSHAVTLLFEGAVQQRDSYLGNLPDEGADAATVNGVISPSAAIAAGNSMRNLKGKAPKKKKHRNSWRFVRNTMAKFIVPLVAVGLWVAAVYIMALVFISEDKIAVNRMNLAADLTVTVGTLRLRALEGLVQGDANGTLVAAMEVLGQEALTTERALRDGVDGVGGLSSDSVADILLFHDACAFVLAEEAGSLRRSSPQGTCTRHTVLGLSSAVQALVDGARPLMASPPDLTDLDSWLELCDDVTVATEYLFQLVLSQAVRTHANFRVAVQVVALLFMLACAGIFMVLARRVSKEVHHILRLTVAMLLLLPEDVLITSTDLVDEARRLLFKQAS